MSRLSIMYEIDPERDPCIQDGERRLTNFGIKAKSGSKSADEISSSRVGGEPAIPNRRQPVAFAETHQYIYCKAKKIGIPAITVVVGLAAIFMSRISTIARRASCTPRKQSRYWTAS
jgi:hypothetical protein